MGEKVKLEDLIKGDFVSISGEYVLVDPHTHYYQAKFGGYVVRVNTKRKIITLSQENPLQKDEAVFEALRKTPFRGDKNYHLSSLEKYEITRFGEDDN